MDGAGAADEGPHRPQGAAVGQGGRDPARDGSEARRRQQLCLSGRAAEPAAVAGRALQAGGTRRRQRAWLPVELFRLAGSRKAGYSEEIVERALAHKVGSTVKRASRRDDDLELLPRADGVVGRLRRRGDAIYAPASAPPDSYVAGMKGLDAVTFPAGGETGLVQLRELLQKAGLRETERQATYAIERGRTRYFLEAWPTNPGEFIEGLFRLVAFQWTTGYGLEYGRPLELIVGVWAALIPVFLWPIWSQPPRSRLSTSHPSGIYQVWPKDRVWLREGSPVLESTARIQRLQRRGFSALGWAAWFSLLSAFSIGFREFSVGSWLSRVHPRQFTLEAAGWVRTVSGLQSLLSVYLLAMWVLTYFGRPFQ